MFSTDRIPMLLGLTFFIVKLLLLLVGIAYFGTKAKDKTSDIALKVLLLCSGVAIFKVAGVTIGNFTIGIQENTPNVDLKYFATVFSTILASFLNIIYLRTGQYLVGENALPGSIYLSGQTWRKVLDVRLVLKTLSVLLIWTFVIFYVFKPTASDSLNILIPDQGRAVQLVYILLNILVIAPISEEIFFRQFSMGIFAKWFGVSRLAIFFNIGLSSIIFSLSHLNMLTNNWIKMAQVFPLGIALGYVYLKKGLEHCIVLHLLFNLIAFFLFSFA